MYGRQIHFGRSGVDQPRLLLAEEASTQEVADASRGPQRLFVARLVMPCQQSDHYVVMSPSIPCCTGHTFADIWRRTR